MLWWVVTKKTQIAVLLDIPQSDCPPKTWIILMTGPYRLSDAIHGLR